MWMPRGCGMAKVVTEVQPVGEFWEAEPDHPDYLEIHAAGRLHLPLRPSRLGFFPSGMAGDVEPCGRGCSGIGFAAVSAAPIRFATSDDRVNRRGRRTNLGSRSFHSAAVAVRDPDMTDLSSFPSRSAGASYPDRLQTIRGPAQRRQGLDDAGGDWPAV